MLTFESFILDVGLYDNIFLESYDKYDGLATNDTWYKGFWEYRRHLDGAVKFHPKFLLQPAREGDRSLTEIFLSAGFVDHHLEGHNQTQNSSIG